MIFSDAAILKGKSSRLFVFTVCFASGIACASFVPGRALFGLLGATLFGTVLAIGMRRPRATALLLAILSWTVGVLDAQRNGPGKPSPGARVVVDDHERVHVVGAVASHPEKKGRFATYLLATDSIEGRSVSTQVRVTDEAPPYPIRGERVRMALKLRTPRNLGNDREFDQVAHQASLGISFVAMLPAREAWERLAPASWIWRSAARVRERIDELCAIYLSEPEAASFRAMILGDRLETDAATKESFRVSGVMHAMVVSGFHVVLLSLAFAFAARLILAKIPGAYRRVSDWNVRSAAILMAAAGFAWLSNGTVPTVRAIGAGIFAAIAWGARRYLRPLDAWALGVCVTLLPAPGLLSNLSFLLTFGVVLGLLGCVPPIRGRGIQAWWIGHANVTVVASSIALTILFWFSGSLNVASILGSFLFTPWFLLPLGAGFLALIFAPWEAPSGFLLCVFSQGLTWIESAARGFMGMFSRATIPYSEGVFSLWVVGVGILLLAPRFRASCLGALLLAGFTLPLVRSKSVGSIHALSVGQGDATLIRSRSGETVLIDDGPISRTGATAAEMTLLPWMRSHGVDRIDLLILTHGDADHVSGTQTLMDLFEVRRIWVSSWDDSPAIATIEAVARDRDIPVVRARQGTAWGHGDLFIQALRPFSKAPSEKLRRLNDASIACMVQLGALRFLALGDLERAGEIELIARHTDLKADLLKVGHHGSRTSTTWELLNAVAPRAALISAGWQNAFHHPSSLVLGRLEVKKVDVFRTDLDGEIRVEVDEEGWSLRSFAKTYPTSNVPTLD